MLGLAAVAAVAAGALMALGGQASAAPPAVAVVHRVEASFVAAGDVSDFDEARARAVMAAVADASNVAADKVEVRFSPASVRVCSLLNPSEPF